MNNSLKKLTVLRGLEKNELFFQFANAAESGDKSKLCYEIYKEHAENNLTAYLCHIILLDENAFSITCARGNEPSSYLFKAFKEDLGTIFSAVKNFDGDEYFCAGSPSYPFDSKGDEAISAESLKKFYKTHGYGQFIEYKAFGYADGELVPIANTPSITLSDLKDYEYEKKVIGDNIVNFIHGLPYSNMLLCGDRGTGKSSTVHAMLNKYYEEGLRIIELNKETLLSVPEIRRKVANNPLKFIVFIDDLSLGESDDKISSLKAALEGSVSGGTGNVMIVATSNLRHIVKESFSERENAVHPSDSKAEQLSLSDRFGLTVMFSTTDKVLYLSIINQLADDMKIKADRKELASLAERWALVKGGRSPRRARQFIDLVYSCEVRGISVEF